MRVAGCKQTWLNDMDSVRGEKGVGDWGGEGLELNIQSRQAAELVAMIR